MNKEILYSPEAERAVIGCLILDSSKIEDVLRILNDRDFYNYIHKIIFWSIIELHNKKRAIDPVTVLNELNTHYMNLGEIELSLYEMANEVPSTKNIISYCEIVKERSIARELNI